jgi:hypothetical protein
MKLKHLLLGSAAVLVAVSGARAADAIVVEPEPVEYVRICDAYGEGWFYIPGTETCLKFDGDVRVDYSVKHNHDGFDGESTHDARYRGRLNVRANNETEYGTLSSRIRFVAEKSGGHEDYFSYTDYNTKEYSSAAGVYLDWAVISLAGFRVGFADNYWSTAGSYGYYGDRFDGIYNYSQGLFFDYTWAGNGWTATVGIEDTWISYAPTPSPSGDAGTPDVYAGVTYSGSGWYLAGIYYYDSSRSAGAWKVRADYDFGSNGMGIGGWYMADDGDTDWVKGHAWGVTAKTNLTEAISLFAGYSEYSDQDLIGDPANRSQKNWTVGAYWSVAPGLVITPEYSAFWFDDEAANGSNFGILNLRIVRSF